MSNDCVYVRPSLFSPLRVCGRADLIDLVSFCFSHITKCAKDAIVLLC